VNAGRTEARIVIVEISVDADAAALKLGTPVNPGSHLRSSVQHDPIPNLRDLLDCFQITENLTLPVRALSLTTPTVSRDFVRIFSVYEHIFPVARESRL